MNTIRKLLYYGLASVGLGLALVSEGFFNLAERLEGREDGIPVWK